MLCCCGGAAVCELHPLAASQKVKTRRLRIFLRAEMSMGLLNHRCKEHPDNFKSAAIFLQPQMYYGRRLVRKNQQGYDLALCCTDAPRWLFHCGVFFAA